MQPEHFNHPGFIRRHCGSVANEAPSDRATGAQQPCFITLLPIHLQGNGIRFHSYHPVGQAFPSGTCLLRIFNL